MMGWMQDKTENYIHEYCMQRNISLPINVFSLSLYIERELKKDIKTRLELR